MMDAFVTGTETAKRLAGAWTLVSNTIGEGNSKVDQFGPNPKGFLMLDATGHWSVMVMRSDLASLASNNRSAGTPDENKAIAQGCLAYFGTYSLNEAERTINVHIESCTFPNWTGTEQKRVFELAGDELILTNANPSIAGGASRIVWKRAR